MKNKEPLLAAISRISNSEYYADDELNFLIKENIPNDSLALPAALSVVDISEENEIIASNFREALRAFANEAPSDQHQQLVAPISVNKSLHFAGLHIKRNADNSFKATYIDPLGAEPKPPYKLANTTIIKKSNEDESAGLFGLLNQASQYFGLAESTEAENLRISLNQVLPHSSIPFHIINALELELGIAPQDIALTTTKIQHPSNNHCGAFTAEILTSLANQSISISENRLTIGDDRKQISDLDQDSSDAVGKVFRENQAEALKEFFDISKKPEKTSSKNSLKKEKNTNSQAIKKSTAFNFQPSKIGLGLLLLSSFSELTDSQGVPPPPSKSTAPTPTPSSSLVTKTPTNSPSYSPSAAPSILTSTPSQKPSSYAPTSNSPTNPPTTNPSSSKPSTFRPTVSLPTPTISPTFQPSTLFPTIEATDDKYPTSIPSSVPSSSNPTLDSASNSPTSNPSQKPSSARPTTNKPSSYAPSELPTIPEEESDEPTTDPTQSPSSFRPNTFRPTVSLPTPTISPTFQPSTLFPTIEATDDKYPTSIPSSVPSSSNPTLDSASNSPTSNPSQKPSSARPTTNKPSSYAPSELPTIPEEESDEPTTDPTQSPSSFRPNTFRPTVSLPTPTISPTFQPSTLFPTIEATDDKYPTSIPSSVPSSSNPTLDSASNSPTSNPSQKPSSARPTTNKPSSYAPSELPTIPEEESDEPTTDPTQSPSSFRPNTFRPTVSLPTPTISPTFQPSTLFPTIEATDDKYPTSIPSSVPSSSNPTLDSASNSPTSNPSQKPSSARPTTNKPSSYAPSELPTIPEEESDEPTTDPTQFPSSFRPSSSSPTSNSPTILETEEPSISPSLSPTSENPKTPTNTTALRSFDEEDVIAVEGLSISSGLVAGSIIRAASSEWRKLPVKFVAETLSTTLLAAGASNSAAVNIFANSAANLLVYSSEVALETVATSYFFESEVGRENNGKDKDENIVNKRRRAAATKASTETDVENNLSPEEKAAITSAIANGLLHALGTAAWAGKPKKEHDIAPFLTLALCGAELDKTSENLLKNFSGQEAKNRDGEWFRKLKNAYHQHLITDGYESVDLTKLQDSLSRALRALSNETKTRVGTRELRHKVKDKFYNPKYRNKSLDEEGQESLRQDLKKLGEELLPRLFSKSDSADIESQTAEPVSYEIIANKLREVLTQHHTAHESLSNLLNSHDKNSQPIDEFNSKIAKLTQVKDSSPNPVIKKAAEKILGFLNESGTSSFDKEGKLINLEAVSILNGINSPLPTISLYAKSVEGKFLDECTGLLDRNKDSELEIIDVEITDEVIGENYFGMTPALNEKADLGRVHRSADVAKNLFPVRRDPSAVGVDFNEIAQSPLNKSTRKKPNPSSSKTSKSNPNAIYSSDHFDEEKKSDYSDEEEKEDQLRAPIVTKPGAKFIQTSQGQHIHPQKTNKHSASAAKKVAISNKETELSSPSLVRPNSQKIPPIPKFENSESYPSRTLNATPRDINSEQSLKNSESNLSLNKINFDDSFNSPQLKRASNHLIRDKQVDLYLPYKRSETDNTKFTLIEDSNEKGEYPILYFHDSESGKVRDFVGYEAIRDSEFSSFLPKDEEEKTIVISNDDQTNFSQLERRFVQTPNKSSGAKPVNIIHCHRVFFSNNISQGDEIEYIESRYQKKYVSLDSSNTPHELTHIQNTPSGQIVSAKKPQRSGSNRDDFLLKDSNKNPDTPSSSLIKRLFPEGSFATTPVATPKNQSGKGK
jgi:hypothetical protein